MARPWDFICGGIPARQHLSLELTDAARYTAFWHTQRNAVPEALSYLYESNRQSTKVLVLK